MRWEVLNLPQRVFLYWYLDKVPGVQKQLQVNSSNYTQGGCVWRGWGEDGQKGVGTVLVTFAWG
jgi:hypothetical protein